MTVEITGGIVHVGLSTSPSVPALPPINPPRDPCTFLLRRVTELGGVMLGGSPADFGKLISDETEKWAKVIRTANIRPE